MRPRLDTPTLALALCLALLRCSSDAPSVAGTGSEVECRSAVSGVVVHADGQPAGYATVRVRPDDFLSAPLFGDSLWEQWQAADTVTDDSGRYCLCVPASGRVYVEALVGTDSGALVKHTLTADTGTALLPAAGLAPTGAIAGRLHLPITDDSARCKLLVYGLDRQVLADIDHAFRIDGLAQGAYRIVLFFDGRIPLIVHYPDSVVVRADSVADIGTVTVPLVSVFTGCRSYECDSAAVRAILDSNGLAATPVSAVTQRDSVTGRIVSLVLDSLSIGTLTANIGSLAGLHVLSLAGNDLWALPAEIGYCHALRTLILDGNRLGSLPAHVLYLDSLSVLSARANALTSVPDGLGRLPLSVLRLDHNSLGSLPGDIVRLGSLTDLSLDYNRLTALPQDIAAWADSLDPGWRDTQWPY